MRISVLDCERRTRSWYTVISPTSGVLSRTNTITTNRKMTSSPRTKDKKAPVLKGDWMISQICWEQPAYLCGSPPCSPNDISSVEQNTVRNISTHLLLIINDYLWGCEESWSLGEITHRIELRPAKKIDIISGHPVQCTPYNYLTIHF